MRGLIARRWSALRTDLIGGLLVMAPLGVTAWVLVSLIRFADGLIHLLPDRLQPEALLGFPLPGLGVLVALGMLAMVGFATRYYAGRRVVELYEGLLSRVPLLSGIYQALKQLIDTILSRRGRQFRQVVLVEYPRRGLYCLAFLTSEEDYLERDEAHLDGLVGIFLPTTPNPTSGFYLMLPRADVFAVDLSVEEAFKLIMSAGIIAPSRLRGLRPLTTDGEPSAGPPTVP